MSFDRTVHYIPLLQTNAIDLVHSSRAASGSPNDRQDPEAGAAVTRLSIDSDGNLQLPDGFEITGPITLPDSIALNFGTGTDISMAWDGTRLNVTQAAPDSQIRFGVSGAGIDLQCYGDTAGRDMIWDQSADSLIFADNAKAVFGTGSDDTISHDGSNSAWTHTTGALTVNNTVANNFTILKGGTATSATGVKIVDSADQVQMSVLNDGSVIVEGTLTPGSLTLPDGSLLLRQGVGTGTGELIEIIGPDSTHGFARYQYEATVSPAATETALFTVPVMSRVIAVQANVQTALTGGGTTVTFSIGITGDVDAYGTASNSGVQADLLTQNAKINAMGSIAANAGASLGVFSAATVALKLCAAATGGASAGDTALSVGTVKIRVLYETLLPIVNA